MSKQYVAVVAYKVLRDHASATLAGCASDVKSEPGRFDDLDAAGAFTRGSINCLDRLGYLEGNLPGGSEGGGERLFEPGYAMSKQYVAVVVYKVLRDHAPATLEGCASDVKSEPDRFGDLGEAGAFTRGAVNCLDRLGYLEGLPGGYSAPTGTLPAGTLPAGACGGAATDPPSRLVDDAKSEDPAWSPDCTRIAYSRWGAIWTANVDGSDARRIISVSGAFLDEPAWSPDGERIAYSRGSGTADGHWESHIWTARADGTDRAKLTSGDVRDRLPAWSPDGERIAFQRLSGDGRDDDGNRIDSDRYVAVMNADGSGEKAVTRGDAWDHAPAWSPDGTRIAYLSGGAVRVMQADGTQHQTLAAGAWWNGGVAWSPDGSRIAFAAGDDSSGTDIVAVDVDGFGDEYRLTDLDGWSTDPSWSPDGQRVAFTHYDQTGDEHDRNGKRYASVVGARSGTPLEHAAVCRPIGLTNDTTAGFPLPDWAPSARGTVRVAVLFMDFPDAQATHTTEEEAARGLPWAEEYLERNSYRKLDVEFVPHHEWLRAPSSYTEYLEESATGDQRVTADDFYAAAVSLADDEIDFSGFHSLAVILPSTHFSNGSAGGSVEADGTLMSRHVNNNKPLDEPTSELSDWGYIAAHELMHNLGLLDMYPYDSSLHERPEPSDGYEWIPVEFGLMELDAYYLADASLMLRRVTRTYPDGAWWWFGVDELRPREMLAWSRWQLGWLNSGQAECVTADDATVRLAPVARTGGGVAMAAVPLSSHEVIVVESRRRIGYDRGPQFTWPRGGTGRRPALIEEGVLVYTVDTFAGSGQLPLKIAGDGGNGQVDDFPVLQVGESVTVRGYTVTVIADDGDTHTVTITRYDG